MDPLKNAVLSGEGTEKQKPGAAAGLTENVDLESNAIQIIQDSLPNVNAKDLHTIEVFLKARGALTLLFSDPLSVIVTSTHLPFNEALHWFYAILYIRGLGDELKSKSDQVQAVCRLAYRLRAGGRL